MTPGKREVGQRVERFETACREAGLKLTHQRIEIFREVAQSGEHPDADAVFRGVRRRLATVSLDTVYRTLWMLSELKLIKTLGPPHDRTRFDANLSQHHHFVCVRCGLTRDLYSGEFDALKIPSAAKSIGQVETTHVELRGICQACANKKHTNRDS